MSCVLCNINLAKQSAAVWHWVLCCCGSAAGQHASSDLPRHDSSKRFSPKGLKSFALLQARPASRQGYCTLLTAHPMASVQLCIQRSAAHYPTSPIWATPSMRRPPRCRTARAMQCWRMHTCSTGSQVSDRERSFQKFWYCGRLWCFSWLRESSKY